MNVDAPALNWPCRDRLLRVGLRTHIMGVLNVTPDSFSDGGNYVEPGRAVGHALRMVADGADIIDVGGESTRPGAEPVLVEEQLRRVIPVIERLAAESDTVISIDTSRARVAEQALSAGAHIINDVSALTREDDMVKVARDSGAGVVLMHMLGTPATMQAAPVYEDVVGEIADFLDDRVNRLVAAGLEPERMAVDPGIGFGKTVEHNLRLLTALPALHRLGRPLVLGLSRKRFIGALLEREVTERLSGSLAVLGYAVLHGAQILRVHDVKESCDVARLMDILRCEESRHGALGANPSA